MLALVALVTFGAQHAEARAATVVVRPPELVGLYRMEAPKSDHLGARRFPTTEVTFLRLGSDGHSRLENVTIHDRDGAATATVELGPVHKLPWEARTSSATAASQLCFEVGTRLTCARYERDNATGDLTLAASGEATMALRLERVRTR